jgi:hypothetical protein
MTSSESACSAYGNSDLRFTQIDPKTMSERRLTSISPSSAFAHAALVCFLLAFPAVAVMRFLQHFDPQRAELTQPAPWWAIWLLFPVGLALAGAVWAMLASLAYNAIARLLGGIRYNT